MPIINFIKYHLRTILICSIGACLLLLMLQWASVFGMSAQASRSNQVDQLARTLTRQIAGNLSPLMNNDDASDHVSTQLDKLTREDRILDASVYRIDGTLIAQSGTATTVRERLGLEGSQRNALFNRQMVEVITENNVPLGFLRVTLDTHVQSTDDRLIDNTTTLIRLMLLTSALIGAVMAHMLLKNRTFHWPLRSSATIETAAAAPKRPAPSEPSVAQLKQRRRRRMPVRKPPQRR
ncbi:YtjB family periplasmic protein [Plesiomonas shigelloides]|uniref:YtjB family periplasmic protein n=1 Tax=Plesiomonas shigelloides TaxID=703 RepID=UPI0012616C4F|nr:AhpA/YtjB family protein [Plesiomonas shigelloides]KAB7688282.1 hypothetical protein GBN20_09645 [Plesiomonas shigelloides]